MFKLKRFFGRHIMCVWWVSSCVSVEVCLSFWLNIRLLHRSPLFTSQEIEMCFFVTSSLSGVICCLQTCQSTPDCAKYNSAYVCFIPFIFSDRSLTFLNAPLEKNLNTYLYFKYCHLQVPINNKTDVTNCWSGYSYNQHIVKKESSPLIVVLEQITCISYKILFYFLLACV